MTFPINNLQSLKSLSSMALLSKYYLVNPEKPTSNINSNFTISHFSTPETKADKYKHI